jgi:hypothetical protein
MWRDLAAPTVLGGTCEVDENAIEGWATAESSSAGYGAGRDRMTSLRSQRSLVSGRRGWIRAWGRIEPERNDPAG